MPPSLLDRCSGTGSVSPRRRFATPPPRIAQKRIRLVLASTRASVPRGDQLGGERLSIVMPAGGRGSPAAGEGDAADATEPVSRGTASEGAALVVSRRRSDRRRPTRRGRDSISSALSGEVEHDAAVVDAVAGHAGRRADGEGDSLLAGRRSAGDDAGSAPAMAPGGGRCRRP